MAGSRQTNTFGEALQKLLRDLADMKVMPDADMAFIVDLETQVISKIRSPQDQASMGGQSALPMDPMGGGMGGPPPGPPMGPGAMPPPGPMPPGVPGLRSNPPMPSGDELARILGGTAQQ